MAEVAKRGNTSINQFIAVVVTEKVPALETTILFRPGKTNKDDFKRQLFRSGGEPSRSGDEL